jgi:hypothetical protein
MKSCERCASHAINEHMHGRAKGRNPELCDVCYWRHAAERLSIDASNLVRAGERILKESGWMNPPRYWTKAVKEAKESKP